MKAGYYIKMAKCKRIYYREHKIKMRSDWKHVSVIDFISLSVAVNEEAFFFSLFNKASKKA